MHDCSAPGISPVYQQRKRLKHISYMCVFTPALRHQHLCNLFLFCLCLSLALSLVSCMHQSWISLSLCLPCLSPVDPPLSLSVGRSRGTAHFPYFLSFYLSLFCFAHGFCEDWMIKCVIQHSSDLVILMTTHTQTHTHTHTHKDTNHSQEVGPLRQIIQLEPFGTIWGRTRLGYI